MMLLYTEAEARQKVNSGVAKAGGIVSVNHLDIGMQFQ
jgi:hypothetical protein